MAANVVLYHADCIDGFTSAWVAGKALTKQGGMFVPQPVYYADEPPWDLCRGNNVFILDFSYSRDFLLRLERDAKSLLVLDHHKTAEEELRGLSFCEFDMNRSGAGMTWDHFFPHAGRHWVVDYVEDRDLWKFELPDSKEVNAYINTYPKTMEDWDALGEEGIDVARERGSAIRRHIDGYVRDLKNSLARKITFMGYDDIPVINCPFNGISEVVGALAEDALFAIGWWQNSKSKFQYGLRSKGDFDVGELAKKLGGGGHKNSAGFTAETLIF